MKDLLSDICVELHVPNFTPAKEFYQSIGYEIIWEKNDYLVMRNGKSVLNFYGGNEGVYEHEYFKNFQPTSPRGYGVEIIIPIVGIEKFYSGFLATNSKHVVAELSQKHSHADFRATDPFGYYLRFVEKYNWVDGRNSDGTPVVNQI